MTERRLKLVKTRRYDKEQISQRQVPVSLSPAEAEEAAYFRQLVEARAARQVMLQQIIAELAADLDEIAPAA
jgi:hypothetical protein